MQTDNLILWITALVSLVGAGAAIYQNWRKPKLDAAQTAKIVIDSDSVKTEIERASRELNAQRDLRVLDLEKWADKLRPVLWQIKVRDDLMCELIQRAYSELKLDIPTIPKFPDVPEFPPPRLP